MSRRNRHFGYFAPLPPLPPLPSLVLLVLVGGLLVGGCASERKKAEPPAPRYTTLPPKGNLPEFMKGTILEAAEVQNNQPYLVSGYGLVVGLDNTGDNQGIAPLVRDAMIDEMVRHGMGSVDERMRDMKPEVVLRDSRSAIVEVYGHLPPGARPGQRVDVFVQTATNTQTTSLARGILYTTNLFDGGVDPLNPKGKVNVYIKSRGPLFVNPGIGSGDSLKQAAARATLRSGTIMNGGILVNDRPIWLRARRPELRVTRAIEMRIEERFAVIAKRGETAKTQDEGIVYVLVPKSFEGDWEHFMGICTHLYLDGSSGLGAIKAKALAQEAVKPNALLQDISYCLEGIGKEALPFMQPLYTNANGEVVFAAARAGAYIGDSAAEDALMELARTPNHPFQLNAVKTLGGLMQSTRIDRMLAELLSSGNALVRIEAYHVLAEHSYPTIISREVRGMFYLDRVPCEGLPMVYATRTGTPRIAVFGPEEVFNMPVMFSALNDKFTISTPGDLHSLVLFDRTNEFPLGGVQKQIRPDLYEMAWRLAGGSDDGFRFGYADLIGILQSMSVARHINCAVVLQDSPLMRDVIEEAPPIVDPSGRPPEKAAPIGSTPRDVAAASGLKKD